MKTRSRGASILWTACLWAALFAPPPAVAAACPAPPADLEKTWGLGPASWAQACAEGRNLDAFAVQVREEFVRSCLEEFQAFPALDAERVASECGKGLPGRDLLRALLAKKAGPDGQPAAAHPARLERPGSAQLDALRVNGLAAESLDRFFTGAAALPALQAGPKAAGPAAQLRPQAPDAPSVALGRSVRIDPSLPPPDQAFLQSLVDRMQVSAEGRVILDGLVKESRLGKLSFKVTMKDYPGTEIVRKGEFEDIQGGSYGEADTETNTLYINRTLSRFRNPGLAVDNTVGTAAHEMTHLWRRARVARTMPEFLPAFDADLADEVGARLTGQLVAAETHRGAATVDTEDARDMLADPEAYAERMKLWSSVYAESLDIREMADPVKAYQKRLKALKADLEDYRDAIAAQPQRLKQISHFCQKHGSGKCAQLRELKEQTEANVKTLPYEVAKDTEAIQDIQDKLAAFKTKEGKKLLALYRRAAKDPRYASVRKENQADLAKLRAHAAQSPLPLPKKDDTQVDRDGLKAWVEKDKSDNPDHAQELD